jgi:aspartate 1-decarboxylase
MMYILLQAKLRRVTVPHADLDHEGAVHGLFRTTVADRPRLCENVMLRR